MSPHTQTARLHHRSAACWSTVKRSTILAPAAVALLVGQNPDGPVATELTSDAALAQPVLDAPTNLSALGSQTQIDIHWDENSRGETGFEIHRSATGAPNSFDLLATVGINATAFSDQGLTPNDHFCYQVRAVRVNMSTTTYSDFSNIACTTAAPVAIVSFEAVFAGGAHTCALTSVPGAAYCWGRGESGQLGVPPPPSTCLTDGGFFSCSMVPVPVGGGLTFEKLTGGGAHTCALTSDGTAACWGNNAYGQLGDNSTTNQNAPVLVAGGLKFVSIDAGAAHTCAITSAGEAYCWGRNDRGQLGDGTTTASAVPVAAVTGSLTFQLIAAGGFSIGHTCALTDLGAAYCWGDNERGQLGTGTSDLDAHASPEPVSGGLVFKGLTAGLGRHSCGLTDLGAAHCWGENSFGALGNRSKRDSAVPVAVVGNLTFDQLVAGGFIGHTCGLIEGGAAYCWGGNEKGQVGDGTTRDRLAPKAVAGGLAFLSVDAGFRHTCGRASTGTVYCWGSNGAGQLGNNSNSLSTVPVEVFGQP
jgi:alpha-tubulin suppressor-like RCC1 family protein